MKTCYFHTLHVEDSLNSHEDMVIDIVDTAAVHKGKGSACLIVIPVQIIIYESINDRVHGANRHKDTSYTWSNVYIAKRQTDMKRTLVCEITRVNK